MQNKSDVADQAIKGLPPVGVTAAHLAGMSINDLVMWATLIYVVLQIAFLLWKWWRIARGAGVEDE